MDINTAFETCIKENRKSHNTIKMYERAFNLLLQSSKLERTDDVSAFTSEHFIQFPSFLGELNYTKSTMTVYLSGARMFINWMIVRDIFDPSPRDLMRLELATKNVMGEHESPLPKVAAPGAAEAIVALAERADMTVAKMRDLAIVHFFNSSGVRLEELVNLKVSNIDFSNKSVFVLGKGKKERYTYFDSKTATSLRTYWDARGFADKDDPAFARHDNAATSHEHLSTSAVYNIVRNLAEIAGVEFSPHKFRHNVATKIVRETGGNIAQAQSILGHSNISTTQRYVHVLSKELEDMHRKIFG